MVNGILAGWLRLKVTQVTKQWSICKLSFIGCIEAEICLFLIKLVHEQRVAHLFELKQAKYQLSYSDCKSSQPNPQIISLYYNLYCFCQSLYLRVFELRFNKMFGALLSEAVKDNFGLQLSKGCLDSLQTQGLDHQMANYLGGSQHLYNFLRFPLGVPVPQGNVADGSQGPSIGGMVDRIFCLLQFEQLPADHSQQFLERAKNCPLVAVNQSNSIFTMRPGLKASNGQNESIFQHYRIPPNGKTQADIFYIIKPLIPISNPYRKLSQNHDCKSFAIVLGLGTTSPVKCQLTQTLRSLLLYPWIGPSLGAYFYLSSCIPLFIS
ncbi:phenylalanine ammonia-lyase [Puccinia sorghi]|uniref:Phenylalanine ammonia-lyase n=1 Tax=Puccinia sorghi TaxID=27349 RepID=A0A0L6VNW5_9BASI|nr:phenylalanine ammonia-lyase [Puccinia sorghi]